MGTSDYEPTFPAGATTVVDGRLEAFVSNFYAVSDDPTKNEEWVSYFAPDAVLVMGDKMARGAEEIHVLRRGMWEKVRSRRHRPLKVFPASFSPSPPSPATDLPGTGAGAGLLEYMLHGTLDLGLKSGDVSKMTWAGRAVLKESGGGELKFALYQVYMHRQVPSAVGWLELSC